MSPTLSSQETYEKDNIVYWYRNRDKLQKPEETILSLFREKLSKWKMLDMGVGGGRTTIHFAPLAKEYIGADFSKAMIDVCEQRFPKQENVSFIVADARKLDTFEDKCLDFIIFSANGIDHINHEERRQALEEAKRVLKDGGVFAFSSHNLRGMYRLYRTRFFGSFKNCLWEIVRPFGVLIINGLPSRYNKMDWAIINDGTHIFRFENYYISPVFQARQLRELGFKNVQFFSLLSGKEILEKDLGKVTDPWIYYLCEK